MNEPYIKKIEYIGTNDGAAERLIVITLSNNTNIKATSCCESWEQWGGTTEELYVTQPIVEAHNDWLHGGELPFS